MIDLLMLCLGLLIGAAAGLVVLAVFGGLGWMIVHNARLVVLAQREISAERRVK